MNKAIGLGFAGEVAESAIDEIERFYAERDTVPTFDVSPLAHPSLLAQLGRRGYYVHEIEQVWVRSLNEGASLPATPIPAEQSDPADREAWAAACVAAFSLPDAFRPPTPRRPFLCAIFHLTTGERYKWLNSTVCMAAGQARLVEGSNAGPRSGKIDVQANTELIMAVSEVVWESPLGAAEPPLGTHVRGTASER